MMRVLALTLLIAAIGLYFEMMWLVWMGLVASLAFFIMMRPQKKAKKAAAEREVLYPVIYEDDGDAPYLYPEKQNITVVTQGSDDRFQKTARTLGKIGAICIRMLKGKKKK